MIFRILGLLRLQDTTVESTFTSVILLLHFPLSIPFPPCQATSIHPFEATKLIQSVTLNLYHEDAS